MVLGSKHIFDLQFLERLTRSEFPLISRDQLRHLQKQHV